MKKKRIIIFVLIVFIGISFAIIKIKTSVEKELKELADSTISNIDLTEIEDGIYEGSCKASLAAAEVKVTINNHKIIEIELVKHDNGKGAPAEAILSKVVEAQSLDVDAISHATYSSKVILKAIQNAITENTASISKTK